MFVADRTRWLILRSDIASIDTKVSVGVNADERAGTRDVGCFLERRTILEGCQRRFDLAEPGINFFRQLFGPLVFALELRLLGGQGVERSLLCRCELGLDAIEAPKMLGVPVA